jgi:hypothetical protein
MTKTAVEWFYQRILAKDIKSVFEQANKMFEEQIKEAYCMGDDNIGAEQYYNETFKSDQ